MEKTKIILASVATALTLASCDPKSAESLEKSTAGDQMEMSEEESRPSPLERKEGQINGKSLTIQYGAPSVKGREVWGDLVPYNVVWRTGANEATYLEVSEEILVEGQRLAPGKYSIFTIPAEDQAWTVIFNSDWDLEHGHFQYNEKNDVLRVSASPVFGAASQEQLSFDFEEPGLVLKWEKLSLPISIQ
ncbi:DUF2911 domain-containing protein [Algoriphagus namhaensis]